MIMKTFVKSYFENNAFIINREILKLKKHGLVNQLDY
jgi:hypothetical protein